MSQDKPKIEDFDVRGIPNLVYAERIRIDNFTVEVAVCNYPAGIRQIVYKDRGMEIQTMVERYEELRSYLKDKYPMQNVFTFRLAFPALTVIMVRGSSRSAHVVVPPAYAIYVGTPESEGEMEFRFHTAYDPLVFPNTYSSGQLCLGGVTTPYNAPFNEAVVGHLDALWYSPFTPDAGYLRNLYRSSQGSATLAMWELKSMRSLEEGVAYIAPVMRANRSGEQFTLRGVKHEVITHYGAYMNRPNRREERHVT